MQKIRAFILFGVLPFAGASAAIPPEVYELLMMQGCPQLMQAYLGPRMSIEQERAEWPFRRFFVDWDSQRVIEVPWASHPNAQYRNPELFTKYLWQAMLVPSDMGHIGLIPHLMELQHAAKVSALFDPGSLDESLRQVSALERDTSQMLINESWALCAVPESDVEGVRAADLHGTRILKDDVHTYTDQTFIEIKTLTESTARTAIQNRVLASLGYRGKKTKPKQLQASFIVIDGRPSELPLQTAILGANDMIQLVSEIPLLRQLRRLRVIGINYDLDYVFQAADDQTQRLMELVEATKPVSN